MRRPSITRQGPSGGGAQPTREPDARRRSAASHAAILEATQAIVLAQGLSGLTIEGVAARAGVGKQTIYRWWGSKTELAIEAFLRAVGPRIAFPDTGDFAADLRTILSQTAALLADPSFGPHAAALLAEAGSDPATAAMVRSAVFTPIRTAYKRRVAAARTTGQLSTAMSDDEILDLAFGPLWFLLLIRPEGLSPAYALALADTVVRAAAP